MRSLPLALLTGCLMTKGTPPDSDKCFAEIKAVELACMRANVIGTNKNPELNKAVADMRECTTEEVKIVCSDTGETKVLSWSY